MNALSKQAVDSVRNTAIPGGWTERELDVAGQRFRLLLPADPDQFLNDLVESEQDDGQHDPYWASLWPAALQMAALVSAREWVAGTRTLELGCGVGLVGLTALTAGLDVTLTDMRELAVATALENARRNGFAAANGHVLDWESPPANAFSLILASDVLYDARLHAPLLDTLDASLALNGVGWIGDPGRSTAERFVLQATKQGFVMDLRDERGDPAASLALGEFRLITIRRALAQGT